VAGWRFSAVPFFVAAAPYSDDGPKIYTSNTVNFYLKKKEPPRELPARRFIVLPFLGSIDPDLLA
jgi:hypothetical protein